MQINQQENKKSYVCINKNKNNKINDKLESL